MSDWKALSFSQPWLDFIMRTARGEPDPKLVENRKRNTRLRGPFLLHAALSVDRDAAAWARSRGVMAKEASDPMFATLLSGRFAAVARLLSVLKPERASGGVWTSGADLIGERHLPETNRYVAREPRTPNLRWHEWDLRWWMRDSHGYLLADVHATPPVPYRGSLGFWRVPANVVRSLGLPPTPEEWSPA